MKPHYWNLLWRENGHVSSLGFNFKLTIYICYKMSGYCYSLFNLGPWSHETRLICKTAEHLGLSHGHLSWRVSQHPTKSRVYKRRNQQLNCLKIMYFIYSSLFIYLNLTSKKEYFPGKIQSTWINRYESCVSEV